MVLKILFWAGIAAVVLFVAVGLLVWWAVSDLAEKQEKIEHERGDFLGL
jgi:hypothetical protein